MKKILIIFIPLILIISNAYADKCYDVNTTAVILDSDKKTGRFFEDQPDVNDDFQVHVVYTLLKDSKDKEGDINGDVEKWVEIADNWILKKTAKANKKSNFNKYGFVEFAIRNEIRPDIIGINLYEKFGFLIERFIDLQTIQKIYDP